MLNTERPLATLIGVVLYIFFHVSKFRVSVGHSPLVPQYNGLFPLPISLFSPCKALDWFFLLVAGCRYELRSLCVVISVTQPVLVDIYVEQNIFTFTWNPLLQDITLDSSAAIRIVLLWYG